MEGSTEGVWLKMTWRFRDGFPGNMSPVRKGGVGLMTERRRCYRQRNCQGQSQKRQNSIPFVGSSAFLEHNEGGRERWGMGPERLSGCYGQDLRPWTRCSKVNLILLATGKAWNRGVKYLICNFVPRDSLYSSWWVKTMRVQFTWINIYGVSCDKPRAPIGHCAAEISPCGPFPQRADILVSYHLKNRSPEEDPSCHSLF